MIAAGAGVGSGLAVQGYALWRGGWHVDLIWMGVLDDVHLLRLLSQSEAVPMLVP